MEVKLTQNKVALIDPEDWAVVSQYKWHARKDKSNGRYYAQAKKWDETARKYQRFAMHRVIMNPPPDTMIDHRNREDTLDNRRSNLRICVNAQNQQNRGAEAGTSKYKCVSWNSEKSKWRVIFNWMGKTHFVGYFADEAEAARAYDAAILPLAGEFAQLNFPLSQAF